MLATGAAYTSDLFVGLVAGQLVFTVNVPVLRDGRVAYVLNAAFSPRIMTELLQRRFQNIPAVISDRRGFIAGRWQGDEQYAGTLISAAMLEHLRREEADVHDGRTKEGIPVVYSYARSPLTGWTATVGLQRDRLESDLRNGWVAGGLLAAAGLAAGLVLPLLLASRLRTSFRQDHAAA